MYIELGLAVKRVGKAIIACRQEGKTSGIWVGDQFKAEADLIANNLLTKELQMITDIPIISEENVNSHYEVRPATYWLIDPIDGTASYVQGFSGFVCQAALMQDGRPLLAAVYAPALDRLYMASLGNGAEVNGLPMYVKDINRDSLTIIDNYPEPRGIAKRIYNGLRCKHYLESGSIGLKICLVSDGVADLFVKDVIVRDWDLAAPHLIIEEAGGILTLLSGKNNVYHGSYEKQGIIATSSSDLLEDVINFLER